MAQPGYPAASVVVVQQPAFGDVPVQTTCPQCHSTVTTTVTKQNGTFAYLIALLVCLVCCPCFWIPLVVDACRDVYHTCPACNASLGVKKPL